jgi:sec-independent protein translocase protein TatA
MGDLLQPTHLMVIAIVLLVLFGGRKLPELGKGLGEGLRGFREGIKGETPPAAPTVQQAAAPQPPAPTETKQG